jgi:hypothetical protein
VSSLLRRVQAAGGFGTVLARGADAPVPVLVVTREGRAVRLHQRMPDAQLGRVWRVAAEGEAEVDAAIVRARRYDPDCWVVELDIPDAARFIGT